MVFSSLPFNRSAARSGSTCLSVGNGRPPATTVSLLSCSHIRYASPPRCVSWSMVCMRCRAVPGRAARALRTGRTCFPALALAAASSSSIAGEGATDECVTFNAVPVPVPVPYPVPSLAFVGWYAASSSSSRGNGGSPPSSESDSKSYSGKCCESLCSNGLNS